MSFAEAVGYAIAVIIPLVLIWWGLGHLVRTVSRTVHAQNTTRVSLPVITNCGQCSFMKREELPQGIPYREGEKRILRLLCSHPSTEIAGSVTPWGITLEGFDEAREKDFRPPGSKIVPPKGCPLRRDVEVVS